MVQWKVVKEFKVDNSVVFFERLFEENWGYMQMRDYRTYEPTKHFRIVIADVNQLGYANNCDTEAIMVSDLGIDYVNKLWYNLEHQTFTKDAFLKELKLDGNILTDLWGNKLHM